jgi:hypothetical protein
MESLSPPKIATMIITPLLHAQFITGERGGTLHATDLILTDSILVVPILSMEEELTGIVGWGMNIHLRE